MHWVLFVCLSLKILDNLFIVIFNKNILKTFQFYFQDPKDSIKELYVGFNNITKYPKVLWAQSYKHYFIQTLKRGHRLRRKIIRVAGSVLSLVGFVKKYNDSLITQIEPEVNRSKMAFLLLLKRIYAFYSS